MSHQRHMLGESFYSPQLCEYPWRRKVVCDEKSFNSEFLPPLRSCGRGCAGVRSGVCLFSSPCSALISPIWRAEMEALSFCNLGFDAVLRKLPHPTIQEPIWQSLSPHLSWEQSPFAATHPTLTDRPSFVTISTPGFPQQGLRWLDP